MNTNAASPRGVESGEANRRTVLLLALFVLSSAAIGVFSLDRDQGFGDDFAAYIMQAQSLVTGRIAEYIRMSTFTYVHSSGTLAGPITVPWGFPLLLAPFVAVFGVKILALKVVLTLCYVLFLIVFFCLARMSLASTPALLLTAVFAFNPTLLRGQNDLLSDIPFLFFSTLALYLIERFINRADEKSHGAGSSVLIGLAMLAAILVRPNGLLLLLPLAAAQWIRSRRFHSPSPKTILAMVPTGLPYVIFGLGYALQAACLPNTGSALQTPIFAGASGPLQPNPNLFNSWPTMLKLAGYYFWLPGEFTRYTIFDGAAPYLLFLGFMALNLSRRRAQDIPLLLYGLATMGVYIVSGGIQGIRYVYPVLPILLLFAFEGMQHAAGWLKSDQRVLGTAASYTFWAGLAIASLVASTNYAWRNMAAARMEPGRWWGVYSPGTSAMFDYVRHHTPTESVIIFFKPRAMRLRTDRNSFLTLTCDNISKGDYVVAVKSAGNYNQVAPDQIESCNPSVELTPVYDEDDFIVYKISAIP